MSSRRASLRRSVSTNVDTASRHASNLVFEFGTAFLRIGIAGESKPRHIFPLHSLSSFQQKDSTSCSYWSSAPSLPSDLIAEKGSVKSVGNGATLYSHQELSLWLSNLYTYHLLLKPQSRRVVILLPIYHPPALRKSLQSILLDDLQVPRVLFSNTFQTIPYAIGRSGAGMIVDIGCIEGRVACFFNGFMCEETLQITPVGYQSLVNHIVAEMNRCDGDTGDNDHEDEGNIDIKHDKVKGDDACEWIQRQDPEVEQYVQESYFDLNNVNSMIYAFFSSLLLCPIDLRRTVVRNIVFVGGGVEGIPQLEHKFVKCVQSMFVKSDDAMVPCIRSDGMVGEHVSYKLKNKDGHRGRFSSLASVIMTAPLGVQYPLPILPSCIGWVGGSIMSSIKSSDEKWVDRSSPSDKEYM